MSDKGLQNVLGLLIKILPSLTWGHSSAGRAPDLHSGGRRFDPVWLHHPLSLILPKAKFSYSAVSGVACETEYFAVAVTESGECRRAGLSLFFCSTTLLCRDFLKCEFVFREGGCEVFQGDGG